MQVFSYRGTYFLIYSHTHTHIYRHTHSLSHTHTYRITNPKLRLKPPPTYGTFGTTLTLNPSRGGREHDVTNLSNLFFSSSLKEEITFQKDAMDP